MEQRFNSLEVDYFIYEGVGFTDDRIRPYRYEGSWSCMYGHLDMIKMFYEDSSINYGIFCEDDIYVRKDFKELMPGIIEEFKYLNLDVLLLGYLVQFKVEPYHHGFELKNSKYKTTEFKYHNYNNDVWGTQMYMLSKDNAKTLLEKYGSQNGYALKTLDDSSITPFSADWTITKDGNRALISPCLATEDGKADETHYGTQGQYIFHKNCCNAHYNPDLFI